MAHRLLPYKHSNLAIEHLDAATLMPDPRNARRHSSKQIAKLSSIIREFGFSSPIIIDENRLILAGHARLQAALLLGMKKVPCIPLTHLDPAQKKALAIADNKMSDDSSFDDQARDDEAAYAAFYHAARARDVLLPPSHNEVMFLSTAHGDDDVAATIDAFDAALRELRSEGRV